MESLGDDRRPDEPHCLWPLCSHPCCWEAELRIAEGIYRRRVREPAERRARAKTRLPSLSVVNVTDWADKRDKRLLHWTGGSHSSMSGASLSALGTLSSPDLSQTAVTKFKDSAVPAIRSTAAASKLSDSKEPHGKLTTVHAVPLMSLRTTRHSEPLLLWIPTYNQRRHHSPRCLNQKRTTSPHCAVKELIYFPPCSTQSAQKLNRKSKWVRKSKRPRLGCSPSNYDIKTPVESRSSGTSGPSPGTGYPSNNVNKPKEKSLFLLRTKTAVLHNM